MENSNNSLSAEEMKILDTTIKLSQHIECDLTPKGIEFIKEKGGKYEGLFMLTGNRLSTQLYKFMAIFGEPDDDYIVGDSLHIYREKTLDELKRDFPEKFARIMKQ